MPKLSIAKQDKFEVWEGVYQSFAEAHAAQKGESHVFDENSLWRERLQEKLLGHIDTYTQENLPPDVIRYDYPLELMLTMLLADNSKLKVLDFGGGLGIHFIQALTTIKLNTDEIQYHIVELPQVAKMGQEALYKFKQLYFLDELPAVTPYNLVHLGSSLQYIEDWQGLLSQLSQYQPKYFVLADVLAGEQPSFVTKQYYYGDRIPVWFLNIHELLNHFKHEGYELIYASKYHTKILGQVGPLPTTNFSKTHQLDATCHLVLKRQ